MKNKGIVASVFGLYAAYFISYLIKISPSAIMPQLQVQLGLTSSQVGLISSMYFLPYAISQFFVGSLCRRFTPHFVSGAGLLLAVVGLVLFGYGNSVVLLALGRFLLGLGTSPFFISLIYYLQKSCTDDEYVRIYGYGIFVGNIASAIASYPIQAFLTLYSRQALTILMGIMALALSVCLFLLKGISGLSCEKDNSGNLLRQVGSDIAYTFSSPLLVCALFYWTIECACLMSYQGLWCVGWTAIAFDRFSSLSGISGVAVSLGVVLSGVFSEKLRKLNPLTRNNTSGGITLFSCGVLSLVSVFLIIGTKLLPPSAFTFALSLVTDVFYGFASGNIIVQGGAFVKIHAKEGRNAGAMGVINGFGSVAQQLSQWLTGIGIDFFAVFTTMNLAFSYTYICLAAYIALILFFTRWLLKMKD